MSDSSLFARQLALAQMKDEFRRILISVTPERNRFPSNLSSAYTDSERSSWYSQLEGMNLNSEVNFFPNETIHKLRVLADRMISAGSSRECIQVYVSVRKTSVDDRFEELRGIERVNSVSIHRLEWQVQLEKIRHWMHAAKICVRGMFAGERTLRKQIFNGFGTYIADDCFTKTVKDSAIELFNIMEAFCSVRRSPEKLFKILDLYNVFSDLLPDILTIFGLESGELISKQAKEIGSRLSEAAREILSECEKAVAGDISQVSIPVGSVHPLTIYVMKYIHSMAEYKQILMQLIVSKPSTRSSELDLDIREFEGQASPLVLHLVCITENLKRNLKAKSEECNDASLAHFFMMNNVHYIAQKIKGSIEFSEMIGDGYLNRLTGEYEAAATDYVMTSWKRVLDCLRNDDLQKIGKSLSGPVSRRISRDKFKAFNAKFEEALRTTLDLATSRAIDIQLQEYLSSSILEMLIPVYNAFLRRHGRRYIKYSAEQVEQEVKKLCEVTY